MRKAERCAVTHPCFQTCGALRQNPKRRVLYTKHLSMILRTRIRLKRMSAQKNNRSPFLPDGEGAQKGRIGHWRYEREWGNASQGRKMRVPPYPWGRQRNENPVFPASKLSPRGEGGEHSEPDRGSSRMKDRGGKQRGARSLIPAFK